MKIKFAILFILCIFQVWTPTGFAQKRNNAKSELTENKHIWVSVDSLATLGQPKSALSLVEKIYAAARTDKNGPQFIKAILYRIRLTSDFREDFFTQTLRDLKEDLQKSSEPATSILHSITAEVYWKYYQNNSYRFRDRTRTSTERNQFSNNADSIATWDLKTISEAIANEYLLSISNEQLLQKIPIQSYNEILDIDHLNKKNREYSISARPTLFDFLAFRALDYFSSIPQLNNFSETQFNPDQPVFFSPTEQFISVLNGPVHLPVNFYTYDSISPVYFAFRIYQSLVAFHLKNNNLLALVDTELERLTFFKDNAPENDSLYLPALYLLEKKHIAIPSSTSIAFQIAQQLKSRGETYVPYVQEKHKWDLKSAVSVCELAIKRFPDSEGAKNCKTLLNSLLSESLLITTEFAVPVEIPSLSLISFKNIKKAHFRLIKTDPDTYAEKSGSMKRADFYKYLLTLKPQEQWFLNLPGNGDHQRHSTEISIPACNAGFYVLICSTDHTFKNTDQAFAISPFWSTQISYIHKRNGDGSVSVNLLDRESGSPLKNLNVEAWVKKYDYTSRTFKTEMVGKFLSDDNGMFLVPPVQSSPANNNLFFKIQSKNDLLITGTFYRYPADNHTEYSTIQTRFFTDRAIYRPGQTIYFKGIVLESKGESSRIKPGHKTAVAIYDVNGQVISSQLFTTNDFGSFNGSFFIPNSLLNGQMSLSNETGSVGFSVEEYKRPAFEVLFNPLKDNYKLNETLTVTGKAMTYTGSPVNGEMVKYRVVRSARYPFWGRWYHPFPTSPEVEIAHGETQTDEDGAFAFHFIASPDLKVEKEFQPVFDYVVYIDVTDAAGETQSAIQNISVGYNALLIGIAIPEKVNLANDSLFKITTTNLNGYSTPSHITLTIQKLKEPDQIYVDRNWAKPDLFLMSQEEFRNKFPHYPYKDENDPENWANEGNPFEMKINTKYDTILHFNHLNPQYKTPGFYRIKMVATDPFGAVVNRDYIYSVYSPDSRDMPVKEINWFVPLKTTGNPGDKAVFMIGSSEKNVDVMYEIRLRDTLVSRSRIVLNNSASLIEIPIEEKYRGNVAVNFLFIRYNRVFQNSQLVTVPYPNKNLDITFETFRSKLVPGNAEQWQIKITGPDKKPAEAEFLTTMYDASLDVFRENTWNFSVYRHFYGLAPWDINDAFRTSISAWAGATNRDDEYTVSEFPRLNWFGLPYFDNSNYRIYSKRNQHIPAMDAGQNEITETSLASETGTLPETTTAVSTSDDQEKNRPASPKALTQSVFENIQIRKDFRETVFFYPSLQTDSLGNLIIKFTAPESLTRWKMLGLAYTKSLEWSQFEKALVTRKDLMIIPNIPRFVRHGDTVVITARIINLSDRNLSGEAWIHFYNGLTGKPIEHLTLPESSSVPGENRLWSSDKGSTTMVMWKIIIPEHSDLSLLQYKIAAQSGDFSDGEENIIPVLTNRMLVTESFPLSVRGKGTVDFNFEKLVHSGSVTNTQTLKNYRLTLEFSTNPAWYALQALPILNEKKYTNADAVFSAFYSNSLASFITQSNPRINAVFQSWKSLTPDALLSNLDKNEQLKSALLEETPWVVTAKEETERKQKLGQYFDQNNLNANLQENLNKLKQLQKSSGGWVWFEGMPENRWLTQNIITGIGHLIKLGVPISISDPITASMINNAITYLDREMQKDFENLKRSKSFNPKEQHLSAVQIQYLYARSYFQHIKNESAGFRKAFDFYHQQAINHWQKYDRYLQGMIALSLNRLNNKEIPSLILKSLLEKAIISSETGIYWADKQGYYWYQAPVETQAMMIEVFDEVGQDEKVVEEMKIWLLKQKQTQVWHSSRATLEAVYALLLRGADLLSEESRIKISMGDEKIDSRKLLDSKTEAGTGYFQQFWQAGEVKPEMGKISVSKSSEGVAWGALYWQYFEDLDKITEASTPLRLNKSVFMEVNTNSGPMLQPISEKNTLKVGDEVKVKIILTSDRDLEFVHMKDMRAAAFEPKIPSSGSFGQKESGLSGYHYQDGLSYYQTSTDVATNFFFEFLPKGTYVFEYPLKVNASGSYSNGITTVQCMYAPEFSAHSEGIRVHIETSK